MAVTEIEWADKVWNPATGCSKVSAGCANCYAEKNAKRFWGKRKFTDVRIHPERLDEPRHWKKPARIFVNSMSDLFHNAVARGFLKSVNGVFVDCPRHTFMVLTKRPERMMEYFNEDLPPTNVWAGVSVENKGTLGRLDYLRRTQAVTRFVSFEPLLEDLGQVNLKGIHWAIVGGESGPGARPFNLEWARSLRDQCRAAGVAFFMKQMGRKPCSPFPNQNMSIWPGVEFKFKNSKGSDMAEWPKDLRIREFPGVKP